MNERTAIILAGGRGTRLSTVVTDRQKCVAKIKGGCFLEALIRQLIHFEFKNIVIATGYKSNTVREALDSFRPPDSVSICYSEEKYPLGTGGAIFRAMKLNNLEKATIFNGDTLFTGDIREIIKIDHNDCTIGLTYKESANRYGLAKLSSDGKILGFSRSTSSLKGLINIGIYTLDINIFKDYENIESFSFEELVIPRLISEHKIFGIELSGKFIDIGIPEDYLWFLDNQEIFTDNI